jgi:hypothetical protein
LIVDVAQSLPGWVSGDLWLGFLVALALTSLSGMVTRYVSNPSRNPTPFILGLAGATVIGSTIYHLLGGPGFRPVRPYAPYGYYGYLIGSLTGLFLLAVVSALRPGR